MGCGSSTGAGGSTMTKDPEDFHLEHIEFKKMQVPEFDEYMCDDVAANTNKIVDIVNTINSCIDDIKEAAVIICGGFKVDIELEGATDHDKVAVTLTKPDGTYPNAEEAGKLHADAKVAKADADLSKAYKALYAAMERGYVKLTLDPSNNLVTDAAHPEVAAFNKAVAEMRTAVGPTYKVVVGHKSAGVAGATCIRVSLMKFIFPNPDSENHVLEPVTILDMIKCKEAKNLFNAELAVAEALAGVTRAVKAAEDAGLSVTFELKKKKLVVKQEGGDPETVADKKSAVTKAVRAANSQLFKLNKAARNANGVINVAKALIAVFEALKAKVAKMANVSNVTDLLKVSPAFKVDLDAENPVEFDFGIKLSLPDFEGKDWLDILKSLLPGKAMVVITTILEVKDKLVELFPEFKPLSEEVTASVNKSSEVFENAQDKIKAAFGEEASFGKITSAMAAMTANTAKIAKEPMEVITTMKNTVMRLNDELQASIVEIKALFP